MNEQILITLPGFQHDNLIVNLYLINLLEKTPEKFYDNIKIESVYDNFPCIWGGGRAIWGEGMIANNRIEESLIPFLKKGIKIRFNFTNTLLKEEHLYDENCNNIVKQSIKLANDYNSKIGIVINSELLENYLRKEYPELEFIYSTTLGQIGLEEINKKTENNILVLDYMYNNNFDFLKQLKHPQNIEVLANEHCLPNCPHRKLHFDIYSAIQLGRIKPKEIQAECMNNDILKEGKIKDIQIPMEDFISNYLPIGINRLKIVGRCVQQEKLMDIYFQWLVKKEYKNEKFRISNFSNK